ncbi:uncharacterized protein BDV17DRAFT_240449 [Aspergillus undulatus]|uniref:uncharacterized protein n=1 Tax=Aspergillus undulatus TaxID=1810928 RepID=UPI003CCCA547
MLGSRFVLTAKSLNPDIFPSGRKSPHGTQSEKAKGGRRVWKNRGPQGCDSSRGTGKKRLSELSRTKTRPDQLHRQGGTSSLLLHNLCHLRQSPYSNRHSAVSRPAQVFPQQLKQVSFVCTAYRLPFHYRVLHSFRVILNLEDLHSRSRLRRFALGSH